MARTGFTEDLTDLREYSAKLRDYSMEELEDIYYHIDVLRQPMRYRLIVRELEARKVRPQTPGEPILEVRDLHRLLAARPRLAAHPTLRAAIVIAALVLATSATTFVLLAPVWLFAVPLHFQGYQTAIVYLLYAPVAPALAAVLGVRLGGRGLYVLPLLIGIAVGVLLFNSTGAPRVIARSVVEQHGGGGFSLGGF